MACIEVQLIWKEHFRDPSQLSDNWNSKREHRQTRELPWMDGPHSPPCDKGYLTRNAVKDAEFCVKKSGGKDKVLKVHQEFQDRAAIFDLIKDCGKQKDLLKGSRLHADILERGLLTKDVSLGNSLLSMYVKCGTLAKAQETFNELPARNVVTWNALIAGYAQHGLGQEALTCFQQMQVEGLSPNAVTFICVLKACGSIGAAHMGEEIHAEVGKQGLLGNDVVLGTALVDMYAKCGALAKAQRVFDKLPARNVVTWNALIAGYAQHGLGDEALSCFGRMQDEGLSPNSATFIGILKACGSIRAAEKGEEIHAEVGRQGLLEKDNALGTALVDMYAKCGMCAKAQAVLDKLPARNVVTWNALITGYAEHGLGNEALCCLARMQDEGIPPDTVTFICILKACGSTGSAEKGEEIHAEVGRRGLLENNNVLGTAVVDMYVKCGALEKAQGVFDKLPTRDVVTWNVLMAGYVQHGLVVNAFSCFGRMQDDGLSPDVVTFLCILKACGIIGAAEKGEEIHAELSKRGLLEKNEVLGTGLVDMYAKCGALTKAQGVLDKLRTRSVVMWNALISGYAQHGLGEEALSCFDQMRDEGLFPDTVTFVCILKACGSIGAIQRGEEIHAEISRIGLLEKDIVLGNALVDMYAKCGALAQAQGVLDNLPARNVFTWNMLIAGYVQHGFNDEAMASLGQMRDEGISPNAVTFIFILKACGNIGAAQKGEEIHAEIRKQGLLENDDVLGTALVDMYAKCGVLAKAQGVFDSLPARNVVTWNALIAGYAQHGFGHEALSCFDRMQDEGLSPDAVTFICILQACGTMGAVDKGEQIHTEVDRQGLLVNNNVLGTALVDMYAKCGALARAEGVLHMLPLRSVVTWNALIAGYAQHGLSDEALSCFGHMQDEGVLPNTVTFICILRACGSIQAVEKGKEIHAEVDRHGLLDKDDVLGTALVDMYAKCGALANAQRVFDKLPARSVVAWNTLIAGYAQHGLSDEALSCFSHMQEEGLPPDAVTFICILKACGSIGAAEKGAEMHGEVGRQGLLEKDTLLGTALVDMYAKCGELAKAQVLFNKLRARGIAMWTALMAGYAQAGKARMVFKLFNKMIGEGMEPDVVTFVVSLTACSHAGLVEEGQMFFDMMSSVYCIIPSLEHHTCMVDMFSRAGHFEKAISMIERVPSSDRLLLWSALMGSCQTWVNVELGKWAFDYAIQLDEKFVAAYICMNNIYAAAGMHEEVEHVEL